MIDRRRFLSGLGGAVFGVPLLDSLVGRAALAADGVAPLRVMTIFFGLGVPSEWQDDFYDGSTFSGPLSPLNAVGEKLALIRNVDLTPGGATSGNHDNGCMSVFVGGNRSGNRAYGPSLEQFVKHAWYGDAGPPTLIDTLYMSTHNRENDILRHVHSFGLDGNRMPNAARPPESPQQLVDLLCGPGSDGCGGTIVGGDDPAPPPAEIPRSLREDRSILDGLAKETQHWTGQTSRLDSETRRRLADMLDHVRDLEKRAFALPTDPATPPTTSGGTCGELAPPGTMPPEQIQGVNGAGDSGVDIDANEWASMWRVMSELYATALQCDLTRFGAVQFQSGGERIRLEGDHALSPGYTLDGNTSFAFRDVADNETSHEYWHRYDAGRVNPDMQAHTHFMMERVADVLAALDAKTDVDGRTVLDNTLVLVSTELGNGNRHDVSKVFHAVAGMPDRFTMGRALDAPGGTLEPDLLNAMLRGLEIPTDMGDPSKRDSPLTGLVL